MKNERINTCPYQGEIVEDQALWGRFSCKKFNSDKKQAKFDFIKRNTLSNITDRDVFYDYYINKEYQFPELKKEFLLNYKEISFLLDFYGIKRRCLKDASRSSKTTNKRKAEFLRKYGVENPSQNEDVKNKRTQTNLLRYKVKNIRHQKKCQDQICKTFIKKYGMTKQEYFKKKSKEIWDKLSESDIISRNKKGWAVGGKQKLEDIMREVLIQLGIENKKQFKIGVEKKFYFYDFIIEQLGILIEVQGDFFHACPLKYKEDDIIPICRSEPKKARDIWLKDYIKEQVAESHGFTVIHIWEWEIRGCKNLTDLENLLICKIQGLSRTNYKEILKIQE